MLISTTYFYGQNVEFTIKFDETSCTYGVYATPDFTNPAFIFAGGSQISIVVPASVDDTTLDIEANTYGWADSSQIYAPAADTSSDFHGVSANGGVVSFTSGVELLMFSFELPNSACCAPGVRLFDNATDPQSTDSGMGGGDFNNYFADALLFTDYYNGNYNNTISIPAPTGDAAQAFCTIDSPTVSSLVTNEADVVWYDQSSGGTAYTGTDNLVSGTTYYGALEPGSCVSSSRLAVTVTLNTTAAPTGDAIQNFCSQDTPTVADLVTNEGSTTWYNQASGGTAYISTDALNDGTIYYGEITANGCVSTSRLAVTANVYTTAAPTGDATQNFCSQDSPTIADLVTNQGNVTWYNQASGGTAYISTDALNDGTTYYGEITTNGCVSTSRLAVTANVYTIAAPTGDATQNFCSQDTPTVADLVTNEGSVTWYNQASGGIAYAGTDALSDGTTYYGEITANGCVSTSRLAVTVNVYSTAAPTGSASQSFCGYDSPTVADLVTNEGSTTWYNQVSGGTAYASTDALVTSTTYYGEITENGCVSTSRFAVAVTLTTNCDITLNIKMMLHGALSGTTDGLMRDDLRTGGHIPEEQPYSSTLNARFTHVNNTGDETTNSTVLAANDGTGDAVVDWVFIEIRNPLDDTEVIKTMSALVQRDGDVVDAATGGALRISSVPETFYVAVKHRNHFGAMTANPITASMGLASIDFTSLSDANTYHLSTSPDNVAMYDVDMTGYTGKALFAGNANYDNKIKYDGVNNDRQTMGSQVLSDPGNTGQVLNFNSEGYLSGDINMDGTVKYDGVGNERQVMQNSVLTYPLNTGNLNNYNNMIEQIPQ